MSILSIFTPRRFGRLLAADAMNAGRDPMLLFTMAMSLAPALAFHFGRDAMNAAALETFGIADFGRYVAPIAMLVPAMLIGWVTGFLLLEDRDDGPLLAVDVTPIGKGGFLAYRVTATALVTAAITLYALPLVVPDIGWGIAMLLALLIGIEAVLAAVVLPAIARNKVEGLALTKLTNIASIVPLIAAFPSPWRYLAGIVPTYWIGELLQLSSASYLPPQAIMGLAVATHLGAAAGLFWLLGKTRG